MNNPIEIRKLRLTPEFILQLVGTLAMFLGLVWWQATFQAQTQYQLVQNQLARERYIPIIEAMQKAQDSLTQRVELMAESTADVRKNNADTLLEWQKTNNVIRDRLETIQVDIAVIKTQMGGRLPPSKVQ